MRTFEELVAEAVAQPTAGWDFTWFAGRATEQRPAWGYSGLLADRIGRARATLDLQTGGAEVYADALRRAARPPAVVAATESWPPNVPLARAALRPWAGTVAEVGDRADLPFPPASFDLVSSRHPTGRREDEVARVLRPGGTHLSQGVGSGSNRELYEALMGPQPDADPPAVQRAVTGARDAGLEVVDVREQATRVEFHDVGAIVHFLRKVVWTVPDFSVDRYRPQLRDLHDRISREGPFVSHSQRYLIEALRP